MTTTPPHNLEAEQAVLGAILVDNEAFYRVAFLEPGHFFEPLHQTIFHISANLIRDGKIASPVSVKLVGERIGLPADLDIGGLNAAQYRGGNHRPRPRRQPWPHDLRSRRPPPDGGGQSDNLARARRAGPAPSSQRRAVTPETGMNGRWRRGGS